MKVGVEELTQEVAARIREELGLELMHGKFVGPSLFDLSGRLSCSQAYLEEVLRGYKLPLPLLLIAFAQEFNLDVHYILTGQYREKVREERKAIYDLGFITEHSGYNGIH